LFLAHYTGINKPAGTPIPARIIQTGDTAMKSWIPFALSILLCFAAPLTAAAGDQAERPLLTKPFLKFARGAVNMVTAPLEVPNQIYILADHADENSRYGVETAAGAIEGLFTGIGIGLWRFVVGAYDLITFPVPVYDSCLIYPTFITSSYEAYYEHPETSVPAGDSDLSPVIPEDDGVPAPETGGEDVTPPPVPGAVNDTPSPGTEAG